MPQTLSSAWAASAKRLKAAGVENPAIDARLLLEAAADVRRADILADPHRALSAEADRRLAELIARRERREPVSQILGRRGFWNIMLTVSRDVLTPRPDTETLVEAALAAFAPERCFTILDLGVGSGALLLAVLAERPNARGLGVDISHEALAVARENAANLGLAGKVALLRGDWTTGLTAESFDLVLANPPYIPTADIAALAPEVRDHEPRLALDGGPDGLEAYRRLAPEILRVLRPQGVFIVEMGAGQSDAVQALFEAAGAEGLLAHPDLAGRKRALVGVKKPLGNRPPNR